jgi:hypothetical protein
MDSMETTENRKVIDSLFFAYFVIFLEKGSIQFSMKKIIHGFVFLLFASVSLAQPKVKVTVYPGTELLNVVHLLSDSAYVVKSTYRKDIEKYFGKYKNHPAIGKARELPFINCDFPLRLSWAFYDFPKVKLFNPATLVGYEKYFTKEQVNDYFRVCLDFYNDTRFRKFYKKYRPEYQRWIASFESNLYKEKMLPVLDSFYRFIPEKEIVITLGALNCGSYAVVDMNTINPHFANTMVIMVAYGNIVGKKASDEIHPDFYAPVWSSQLVLHELGHAYLDGLFEQYKDQVNRLKYIFDHDSVMQKQAKSMGWAMYLNENITQAVTSFLRIQTGKMDREAEMKRVTSGPFYVFVQILIELIEKEYGQMGKYVDFREFFPVLLEELGKRYASLKAQ